MTLSDVYNLPNGTHVIGWMGTIWEKTDNYLECITPGESSDIKAGEIHFILSFKRVVKKANFKVYE